MLSMRSGSSRSEAARGRRKQVLPTTRLSSARELSARTAQWRSSPSVASAASTGEPGVVLGVTNRHGEAGDASTLRKIVRGRTYVRTVQRMAGTSLMEGVLID